MEMARISATSDIVFKYLFGAQTSTEILKAFVNAVQRHAGLPEFRSLEIINPIGEREYLSAKLTVIDVKARATDGTVVNVEVQVRTQAEYGERSLYYWAKSYTEQVLDGQDYRWLRPVVSVSLLNFVLLPPEVPYHSTFQLREKDRHDILLTNDCVLHYLELPKIADAASGELVDWLYALKHLDEKEGLMSDLLKRNQAIQELAERYHRFERTPEARMAYDDRVKFLNDQASLVGQAQREGWARGEEEGRKFGLQKGREEGLQEGREVGLQEGREVGREEGAQDKAYQVAKELLDLGLPLAQILGVTKLTETNLRNKGLLR